MTNTPGIKQQRPDRVNLMINSLEKNGYILSVNTSSNLTFYKITKNGIDGYEKWIKDFLDFARNTSIITADVSSTTTNKERIFEKSSKH